MQICIRRNRNQLCMIRATGPGFHLKASATDHGQLCKEFEMSGSGGPCMYIVLTTESYEANLDCGLAQCHDGRCFGRVQWDVFTRRLILESPPPNVVAAGGGVHKFLHLQKRIVVCVARNPFGLEADGLNGTKFGAAFETYAGRRVVGAKRYMEAVNALRPDIWASLPDEVPAWATPKRHRMSVDRTLSWLDECLSLNAVQDNVVLGVVLGGSSVEERRRSAQETARRDVSGFSLGGFGLGEAPEERGELLKSAIDQLPDEKVRHVSGLGMPEEVLEGVAAGIDLFDSTYPHTLTMKGCAMIFPLSMGQRNGCNVSHEERAESGSDSAKLDMHSTSHRLDTNPIMKGCQCYTCRKHTRAYIHHLLNVHEMLGQTLLDIHNYHHYISFFGAIRESIAQNYFQTFRDWFTTRQHCIAGADAANLQQSHEGEPLIVRYPKMSFSD